MTTKRLTETVSLQTQNLLAEMPELLDTVTEAQQRPPLPLGYVPSVIEVLFEDVLYLKSVDGVLLLARECLADYQPRFVEYRFDDEMALFQVGRDVLVNRIAS
ncbi:hypothetical protein D0962_21080 [Leptolyngbyaceae cyanobacterium CCMR0082]|uniref:Uncharacterized protein n=1 Tax=Adonisia turfae CCMR0082 TaxID=2304604 RepID=A0A6M0S9V9_9CYAN|nr:hypothetical protein [Adonisia turfae]NEZ65239.1 hypothetical protein [Adonisia turfae CCMR0082]